MLIGAPTPLLTCMVIKRCVCEQVTDDLAVGEEGGRGGPGDLYTGRRQGGAGHLLGSSVGYCGGGWGRGGGEVG